MSNIQRVFQVDGRPFFTLGGQSRNSSGYNPDEFDHAFKALRALRGNTLEIPIYWEQVERTEGVFDFTSVGQIIARAREEGVKLVLLWFATWKNGTMDYTPAWVKEDPERFKRVVSPTGRQVWVLSSHCTANFEADRKAFLAFCTYLKDHDEEGTVIAVQIENEPGIVSIDRDYGPDGQAEFERPVPDAFLEKMNAAPDSPIYQIWQAAGGVANGSWPDLFGHDAGELMTAYSIALYIDKLAAEGKQILPRPMYINVWLGEMHWRIAGESYPSGGPTSKTLDIYKWFTPHIDLIAPDIYIGSNSGYAEICETYSRPDNPLFVPESMPVSSNAWLMFRAIADYNAIGYHIFAIENILSPDGSITPYTRMVVESFHAVAAVIPLIHQYQGTGRIHAVVQEENMAHQIIDFDGYHGMIWFGDGPISFVSRDWRHPPKWLERFANPDPNRGRGLIFQVSEHEFYLVGDHYRLVLRPRVKPEMSIDPTLAVPFLRTRTTNFVSVDEGYFDEAGNFVVNRHRNGDETDHGVWVEADVGVIRVKLTP